MKEYTYKEWKMRQCKKLGHDWAFQDCETFMTKTCLRCGATQFFFPEEVEEEPKIWGQTWSDDNDDNRN